MKIAVFSDIHLGFGTNTELWYDAFDSFKEAMKKSLDCDVILIAGDMFDSRNPGTDVLARAMEILMESLLVDNDVKIVEGINKDVKELSPIHEKGIPVIAIHGTHERRVKGFINPVEALEKAGFLIHLHCSSIILEKNNERICVHGMSGVPDHYTESVLQNWNPKPVRGCFNILMLHQSLKPFMYAEHLTDIEKLPKGFDIYICGHIHEAMKYKHRDSLFLIPGSFIVTQITKEALKPKGFWKFDTRDPEKTLEFVEFENQRKIHIEEINEEATEEKITSIIKNIISQNHAKKPVIRIKLLKDSSIDLNYIAKRYSNHAILSFKKSPSCKEGFGFKTVEEHKLSVEELGKKLLRENIARSGLDIPVFENVFEFLLEGKAEEALNILKSKIKVNEGRNHDQNISG